MVTRLESLISWLALPVYMWQGLAVRRRTTRMPPPETDGWVRHSGAGKPLHLLVVGDSSAAGVGAATIENSLGGVLASLLAEATARPVAIRVAGMNSATAADIRDFVVPNLERSDFDYVCLNIGINDAKNFHSGRRFCRDFGTLIYALKAKFPGAVLIWSGVLDLEKVPALPTPLNRILGIRSRIIDRNGRILCRERGAHAPPSNWRAVRENFAADGFHASERGYREWADGLADYILRYEGG